ncbi:PhzF family phenazine biosynthesis protein [Phaeacidiphilus oryzae]|jgi:PhzF family phenazine biosynthesis protein|uniref:PhzF family phenazine biosynthesis protein n=1 Tax=Phaeacidiphilus oryzae TaxID=348818 RepID=UPI000569442C|nr:PhzF family phenazine biosynthesis protein [Phaeacidiphilus oryzae]
MRIRTVDAFTDRPFAGNPAGVCLLPEGPWPEDEVLASIAMEMNLAETAFTRPRPSGGWELRWFTPAVEVRLCGHATLATAHALREDGLLAPGATAEFDTLSGRLTAEAGQTGAITLDFPANPPTEVPVPEGLVEALGSPVVAAYETGELGDLLVELADESTVRGLVPDLGLVVALATRGVITTAAAGADGPGGYDYVSRFFGPAVGVPEDPVTGSAHTALAPFWSDRLGRTALTGYQASRRGGLVRTEAAGARVRLTGHAVTTLEGDLRL